MKKNFQNKMFFGFTLIELLVVISIIGMLAGLLLPAVNSARESGRRVTCISNQKQIAFQLITQADTSGFVPLAKGFGSPVELYHSWVVPILPLLEEQDIATQIKNGDVESIMDYTIPVLKCKSSGKSSSGAGMSYVVNGGVQGDRRDKKYSPFLIDVYGAKIDDIKSTSKTVILSENLQAGNWSYSLDMIDGDSDPDDNADPDNVQALCLESHLAFVYPMGSPISAAAALFGTVTVEFINENETGQDTPSDKTARPSSNHPGTVVSSFADGGVRPLNDSIDKEVFIKLCQPSNGNIDAKDLGW
ncbi:MAG: DUF1559 domain-containing protein [Planctomycetaceae bacterium]|jgi:prepilin-type N-terminal cleavage/methylation domain-containing protein|nr:DUF1559 domain-containing protein [Planctomycetaceae bacterium]